MFVTFKELIRNSDSLRTGRSGDEIPVGGDTFRTRPDRPTLPPIKWVPRHFLGGKEAGACR